MKTKIKKDIYVLTVLGRDRVGIISAVAGYLSRLNINMEDSSMTRLRNEFAMILLISSDPARVSGLPKRLEKLLPGLGFELRRLAPGETLRSPEPRRVFALKIYGADKIGIVAAITRTLSARGINIVDMRTRLLAPRAKSTSGVYIISLDAVPPRTLGKRDFLKIVRRAAARLGVSASLEEYEPAEL